MSYVETYTSTVPASGDAVDFYYPRSQRAAPVVVLLQGANVDKAQYSGWASSIASLGFAVQTAH